MLSDGPISVQRPIVSYPFYWIVQSSPMSYSSGDCVRAKDDVQLNCCRQIVYFLLILGEYMLMAFFTGPGNSPNPSFETYFIHDNQSRSQRRHAAGTSIWRGVKSLEVVLRLRALCNVLSDGWGWRLADDLIFSSTSAPDVLAAHSSRFITPN